MFMSLSLDISIFMSGKYIVEYIVILPYFQKTLDCNWLLLIQVILYTGASWQEK